MCVILVISESCNYSGIVNFQSCCKHSRAMRTCARSCWSVCCDAERLQCARARTTSSALNQRPHGTRPLRKPPAGRPRDPDSRSRERDSRSRDRDSRSRPNQETGDFPIPDSGRVGNRGFPPRFPAKSGKGGTGIGDFRVCMGQCLLAAGTWGPV